MRGEESAGKEKERKEGEGRGEERRGEEGRGGEGRGEERRGGGPPAMTAHSCERCIEEFAKAPFVLKTWAQIVFVFFRRL